MKKLISLLLVLALVLTMTACGGSQKTAIPAADEVAPATHVVVDHNGNEVELPYEINRIAVCGILPLPSVIAIFFDSAEKIVGMSDTSMNAAANSLLGELYPEILKAETDFINGTNVNVEELLKLQPDVVFYHASQKEVGDTLQRAGFPAVAISVNKWNYNCIETLNNWISLLSEIFPDNDKTAVVEEYSNKMYDLVQSRVTSLPEGSRERAFFLYQYSDTVMMSSGRNFFGQWWADAIGARNVAEEVETDNQITVNLEQVYAWNPSLIFITNFTTANAEDLYNGTVGNDDWSAISAVQNRNVYKMPLGMYRSYTPGVDTPVTLLWLAKTAYPEIFSDIDIIAETKTYYKEVFGIDLTDTQAASIFTPAADAGTGF